MKIVCDDKIPFLKGVFEPYAEVLYLPGKETRPETVRDADALITRTRTVCDRNLLEGSGVKIIATATIGYDHIDTSWCESAGIEWANAPGCNSSSVRQYVTSVLCRLVSEFGLRFENLTLGVVGVGHVGSKVADAASALGMKVLLCDPPRARKEGPEGFVDLEEIIDKSDIITLHVPLSKEGPDATWHLFDSERLSELKPSQIFVNSSRGPIVDNASLKECLKRKSLKAAVLDVWENEPEIDRELLDLLALATPHIAGYSADGKANGTAASVRTVARKLDLPLGNWSPSGIPAPRQALDFRLDAAGKTPQEVLCEAVLHTYDVAEDDTALRKNPGSFEKLRGDYPVRREFTAFHVSLDGGAEKAASALRRLGFEVD
ncbi:MAG: 4-phosphoerythronate dehydrogenase PdxB [Bacteroidales bacterium]|nr:4-phosphoerythronate dehydrogenase PdxB [Bacteroidales bacterium]